MGYIFAGENNDPVAGATRRASVNGPAHIDVRAFFMPLLIDAHTAAAFLNDLVPTRETSRHWIVVFNGTGSRPFVVSRGGGSGKYITRGTDRRRPSPTTPTCPMNNPSSPRFTVIFGEKRKKSSKSFGGMRKESIFAASKLTSGQNAAGNHPAIFVPPLYRNHRITMPCRESGNRPGGTTCKYLTARSMVTLFCQNLQVMNQKQIGVPFTLVSAKAIYCRMLAICCNSLQKLQDLKERENAWFSALCQERVTNHEVLVTAVAVCVGLPLILIIAGLVLEGGAS